MAGQQLFVVSPVLVLVSATGFHHTPAPMKLDSKYFDSIRVGAKRRSEEDSRRKPVCQWKGCTKPGTHRAPKGRGHDGDYLQFCVDHVRQYNATYNYFDGMSDTEVSDFQKDALTGHRPTWKVGANSSAHGTRQGAAGAGGASPGAKPEDPNAFFAWRAKRAREEPVESRRQLRPLEKKAMETLQLAQGATKDEIKARFKEQVKRHHPDANGGDTKSEEILREIIQAYNYLKQAGLV
jgi:DnaJ domain